MARITIEDCLEKEPNRFSLVRLTSRRAKQILNGSKPVVESKNRPVVSALREIAAGKVSFGTNKSSNDAEVQSENSDE